MTRAPSPDPRPRTFRPLALLGTGLLLAGSAALFAGCSGTSSAQTGLTLNASGVVCQAPPAACGGDVVGKWKAVSTCYGEDPVPVRNATASADCSAYVASVDTFTPSGTAEFTADLHSRLDMTFAETDTYSFSKACLVSLGDPAAEPSDTYCSGTLTPFLKSQGAGPDTACTFQAGNCVCKVVKTVGAQVDGTYKLSGTQILDGAVPPVAAPTDYCVQGDTMVQRVESTDSNGTKTVVYTLLQRQ